MSRSSVPLRPPRPTRLNQGPGPSPVDEALVSETETRNPVQMSFDGLLLQQFHSLNVSLEKLNSAIMSLKPQPQSSDKKTAFWTAYKSLVDEFDQEFQRKYGNDLDTALIFAGLFSAVSSAFIIQVQPDLQPNQGMMPELLGILVQNMNATTAPVFAPQTGPPVITIVAQSLLYFSLFATLLTALLAVLGKQWLLHYDSVGERGTIEERGLERQRKFEGLKRWKFDLVMQIFPLLLQLALLLFAVALSFYLWTINRAIAGIILGLTVVGFILHDAMVISALVFPDSPFQTSLTTLLGVAIEIFPVPQSLHNLNKATGRHIRRVLAVLRRSSARTRSAYSSFVKSIHPLLPQFNKVEPIAEPSSPQPIRIFEKIPLASKEVPAVVWALETSTDPKLVEAAAALTPNLQWPIDLDLRPSLKRLSDTFNQCLDHRGNRRHRTVILDGMRHRSISCIKAFGVLEMTDSELESVDTPPLTQWSLRFIAAQNPAEKHLSTILKFFQPEEHSLSDLSLLSDFLFCINSFFVPPDIHDLSVMDKSEHHTILATLLFENLANRLTDPKPLDPDIATGIVAQILKFKFDFHPLRRNGRSASAVYRFCAVPALGISAIISALRLLRLDALELHLINLSENNSTADVAWAYRAMEHLHTSQAMDPDIIGDLLQIPLHHGHVLAWPSIAVFRTILWALSCGNRRTSLLACIHLLLPSVHHWFEDNALRPILQQDSTWTSLGIVLVQAHMLYPPTFMYPMMSRYITLGDKISQMPEWTPVVTEDLSGWLVNLTVLLGGKGEQPRQQFCAVLARLWNASDESEAFEDEKALVMSFAVLADTWDQFDLSSPRKIQSLLRLIECTVSIAFCARLVDEYRNTISDPSQCFKDIIMPRLGQAVLRATERLNGKFNPDLNDIATSAAQILSRLASTINDELKNRPQPTDEWMDRRVEIGYWRGLQTGFEKDIKTLPGFSSKTSLIAEVPDI
ncbi:hypothetical protein MVEN_02288400 [Mycena venus]|uniref:DUF6535 domain-containing protein n=1 Tax=Mycena venus TaxID=2733690 RepID=A0A8H7CES1_9AGAR|nr:hypothetical protein MVEN_02288400 [Mycena venus]